MQTYCWLGEVMNGATGGVTGQYKRMEALKISLENKKYSGEYSTERIFRLPDGRVGSNGKWPGQPDKAVKWKLSRSN